MTLNPRISSGLEKLATDLLVDRHGDPHLAFVVLLYPDEHGRAICVGYEDRSPRDLGKLQFGRPEEKDDVGTQSAKTMIEELNEARLVLDDLDLAFRIASAKRGTLESQIDEHMTAARERRLIGAINRDFERAQHEAKYSALCQFCGHRFTPRGVGRHERNCYKNPDAIMYGPAGDSDPIIQDGRIIGSQYRHRNEKDQARCARCPEPRYRHPDDGPCAGSGAGGGCSCAGFVPVAGEKSDDAEAVEPIRSRRPS